MNYQQIVPISVIQQNNTLFIEADPFTSKFNKSKISTLYFGQSETLVSAMIDEMNMIRTQISKKVNKLAIYMLIFMFCVPCIICYVSIKFSELENKFKSDIQIILEKNKKELETFGITCALISEINGYGKNRRITYKLEFQQYGVIGLGNEKMQIL